MDSGQPVSQKFFCAEEVRDVCSGKIFTSIAMATLLNRLKIFNISRIPNINPAALNNQGPAPGQPCRPNAVK